MTKNKSALPQILIAIGIGIVIGAITGFITGSFDLPVAVIFPVSFVSAMAAFWLIRNRQSAQKE